MTPDQEQRRGEDAARILKAPVYLEAYQQIEANIVTQMAQQAVPADKAEDLRKLLIALRKVRVYMEQVMQTGTMAAMEDERKRSVLDAFRRRA